MTAQKADRCGSPDPEQPAFATTERRVMVTCGADFPPPLVPIRRQAMLPGELDRALDNYTKVVEQLRSVLL